MEEWQEVSERRLLNGGGSGRMMLGSAHHQRLVGNGKGILDLEAAVAISELITSPLLRLDILATGFL
jgi:hypothetical protein